MFTIISYCVSGGNTELASGKTVTVADMAVGFAGWYILIVLFLGIRLLIQYARNKERLKIIWQEQKEGKRSKEKYFSKKDALVVFIGISILIVIFFIGLILFLCAKSDGVTFAGEYCMLFGGAGALSFLTVIGSNLLSKRLKQ
ncbi:MAG: hypothetical protein K2G44_01390 [Clostridia bacterium]|nr:hypothetical protein [Clostridia bacterium]